MKENIAKAVVQAFFGIMTCVTFHVLCKALGSMPPLWSYIMLYLIAVKP